MKYAVWFVRLVFASWMIPAGLNHFISLFPQPMGTQPLSQELIIALLDSHLFDLVKAVELLAGVCVLFGFYTPLALLVCMPVSFCVFYWDAPLEGWGSSAALYGYAALLSNVLLCLAWYQSYRPMVTLRAEAGRKQLVLVGRILFGAWMALNGASYLFLSIWPVPTGHEPLAIQLMTSLVNSRLLDVAMTLQLLAGALILTGLLVPAALCVLMPISTCALFWAVILDHQPLYMALALAAFALNGLLMLAYLRYYQGTLQRHTLALGEGEQMNFDALLVNPDGHTSLASFVPAMITVLAVIAFYSFVVTGRTAQFCVLVLLYPACVLLARRLRDMGYSAWLLLAPLALLLATIAIQLGYFSLGAATDGVLPWVALAVAAAFVLWGGVGQGITQSGPES